MICNMSYVCITVYNILFESFCVADFVSCRQKSDCQSSSSKTTHFYFLRFCSMRRGQSVGASFKLLCKDIRYVPPNGCIWDVQNDYSRRTRMLNCYDAHLVLHFCLSQQTHSDISLLSRRRHFIQENIQYWTHESTISFKMTRRRIDCHCQFSR